MARVKNIQSVINNLQPRNENLCRYRVADILEEIRDNVDERDFVSILEYLMVQPYSKVHFMVKKCADLPIFVKNIASAFLDDTKKGKTFTIQSILNRVYGLPKSTSNVNVNENNKPLLIEFANKEDAMELNEFLNESNECVRKDD